MRSMQRLSQQRHVVAERAYAIDQCRALLSRWFRFTRQDPQVLATWFADDGPCVVIGVIEHPVVAHVERSEERHFELRVVRFRHYLRLPFGLPECSIHAAAPT